MEGNKNKDVKNSIYVLWFWLNRTFPSQRNQTLFFKYKFQKKVKFSKYLSFPNFCYTTLGEVRFRRARIVSLRVKDGLRNLYNFYTMNKIKMGGIYIQRCFSDLEVFFQNGLINTMFWFATWFCLFCWTYYFFEQNYKKNYNRYMKL